MLQTDRLTLNCAHKDSNIILPFSPVCIVIFLHIFCNFVLFTNFAVLLKTVPWLKVVYAAVAEADVLFGVSWCVIPSRYVVPTKS